MKSDLTKKERYSTKLLIDVPLLVTVILLLISGLLVLYSASWNYSLQLYDSGTTILMRQIMWVLIGIVLAAFLTSQDYHRLMKFSGVLLIGVIGLLLIVLLDPSHTSSDTGYTRSILGNGSVQPSELAKIALICYLSVWLSTKTQDSGTFLHDYFVLLCITGFLAGIVVFQPDYSTAIMIVILVIVMLFIAGSKVRPLGMILLAGLFLGFVGYFLFPTKIGDRINDFYNGLVDPQNASYHIQRSFNAILSGGLTGVGLGKGAVKLTGLPVAWTDSIFAVILEETGFIGGLYFICLYMIILWRGRVISKNAVDPLGKILSAGITMWILMEAMLNIAVMVNLMPFAGNALPFVSYGGSSMLCMMGAAGLLLSVSRHSAMQKITEERSNPDALADLRRRDWGWSVSRPGSSSGRN